MFRFEAIIHMTKLISVRVKSTYDALYEEDEGRFLVLHSLRPNLFAIPRTLQSCSIFQLFYWKKSEKNKLEIDLRNKTLSAFIFFPLFFFISETFEKS